MVDKSKSTAAKKKAVAPSVTSQSIEEQTQAFLKAGGKVEYVNAGVSGQQNVTGRRHITIGTPKS